MIVGASIVAVQSILYTEWDRRTIKLTTTTDIIRHGATRYVIKCV